MGYIPALQEPGTFIQCHFSFFVCFIFNKITVHSVASFDRFSQIFWNYARKLKQRLNVVLATTR